MQNQYVKSIKLVISKSDGIIKLKFRIDKQAYEQIKDILGLYQGEILERVALEKDDSKNQFTIVLKPAENLFEAIAQQLKAILKVS